MRSRAQIQSRHSSGFGSAGGKVQVWLTRKLYSLTSDTPSKMATTVPSHESIIRPEAIAKQVAAQDAVKAELAAKAAEAKKVCWSPNKRGGTGGSFHVTDALTVSLGSEWQ